jgi:hypothetical protein
MNDLVRWLRHQWDRAAAVALVVIAGLLFLLGWLGISDSALATQQIPYLASGGLFGLMALGVGATLWLSADLRDEWRKLDEISEQLGDAVAALTGVDGVEVSAGRAAPATRAGAHSSI